MSLEYNTDLKNTRLRAIVSAIGTNGLLNIYDSSNTLLAVITLASIAGTVSDGVLTITSSLSTLVLTTGVANYATITTSTGTIILSGITIGTDSNYMISMSSTSLVIGKTLSLTSFSIIHE